MKIYSGDFAKCHDSCVKKCSAGVPRKEGGKSSANLGNACIMTFFLNGFPNTESIFLTANYCILTLVRYC